MKHFVSSNASADWDSTGYDSQLLAAAHIPTPDFITYIASVWCQLLHPSARDNTSSYADIAPFTVYT